MSRSAMSPDDIAKLKREVLAAEQGSIPCSPAPSLVCPAALEASKRVKVDRLKHAAQLRKKNEVSAPKKERVRIDRLPRASKRVNELMGQASSSCAHHLTGLLVGAGSAEFQRGARAVRVPSELPH